MSDSKGNNIIRKFILCNSKNENVSDKSNVNKDGNEESLNFIYEKLESYHIYKKIRIEFSTMPRLVLLMH